MCWMTPMSQQPWPSPPLPGQLSWMGSPSHLMTEYKMQYSEIHRYKSCISMYICTGSASSVWCWVASTSSCVESQYSSPWGNPVQVPHYSVWSGVLNEVSTYMYEVSRHTYAYTCMIVIFTDICLIHIRYFGTAMIPLWKFKGNITALLTDPYIPMLRSVSYPLSGHNAVLKCIFCFIRSWQALMTQL